MDELTKDALFLLAIEMDVPTLLNFCSSSQRINDLICKRDDIWNYKLHKEVPKNLINLFIKENPKKEYLSYKKLISNTSLKRNIIPIKVEKRELLIILKELIILNDKVLSGRDQFFIIYIFFSWLDKNRYLLLQNKNFRNSVKDKLKEFKKNSIIEKYPIINQLLEEFNWIENL